MVILLTHNAEIAGVVLYTETVQHHSRTGLTTYDYTRTQTKART